MTRSPQLLEALRAVSDEVLRGQSIYGTFASAHEGYAVLLEEVDELKDEVWKGPHTRDYDAMMHEACQVAAVAVRLMIEIAEPHVIDEYRHVKSNGTVDQIPELPLPTRGALDTCKMCGGSIWYADPYWDHQGENKPRHPATPTNYALYIMRYMPTAH